VIWGEKKREVDRERNQKEKERGHNHLSLKFYPYSLLPVRELAEKKEEVLTNGKKRRMNPCLPAPLPDGGGERDRPSEKKRKRIRRRALVNRFWFNSWARGTEEGGEKKGAGKVSKGKGKREEEKS